MFQRRRFKTRRSGNTKKSTIKGQYYESDSFKNYGGTGGSLANFDACIEACDAFAASSGGTVGHGKVIVGTGAGINSANGIDGKSGNNNPGGAIEYAGKSIVISPDGELLSCNSIPAIVENAGGKHHANDQETASHDAASSNDDNSMTVTDDDDHSHDQEFTHSAAPSHHHHQHQHQALPSSRQEEFESSIYIGNDVMPDGEKVLNGFNARGWNPIMTTMSVRRAVDTLQTTGKFVEELILSRKNSAANASQACEQLRGMMVFQGLPDNNNSNIDDTDSKRNMKNLNKKSNKEGAKNGNGAGEQKEDPPSLVDGDDNENNDVDEQEGKDSFSSMSASERSSAGPLLFPGSSLYDALVAMEQYNSKVAEADAHRWRMASNISMGAAMKNDGANNGEGTRVPTSNINGGVLPTIQARTRSNYIRAEKRERALMDSQQYLAEAESFLRARKDESRKLWSRLNKVENEISRKVEEKLRQRSRERELKRRQEENERHAALSDGQLQSTVTQQEIWELVAQVGADNDGSFAPHDLPPPNVAGPIDQTLSNSKSFESPTKSTQPREASPPSPIDDYRAELEDQYRLHDLHAAAAEADENVSDAAGKLLNAISASDTTKRSARLAAETCLLSCANSQMNCLKSLVQLEKDSLNERLLMIEELEEKVNTMNVRADLNLFIEHEKSEVPNGTTSMGDNDDGGIASALATLNSFSEGIGVGVGVAGMAELSSFSGWNDDEEEEVFHRDDLEDAVGILFKGEVYTDNSIKAEKKEQNFSELERSIQFLEKAVSEKSIRGRGYRASTCYALNNYRGKNTHLHHRKQYDGLCRVLDSLLDGCDREAADVANAKMCMMLAQTFYYVEDDDASEDRTNRLYPKEKLCHHPIWLDEDFWTQALFQCVTDSLANSGVMVRVRVKKSERNRKMKWHDLNIQDRADAASQIHAVIFSQLGALAHSMVEFGCSVEQACAFVRRLSVRHQLPLSQRAMLLSHLMHGAEESMPDNTTN